MKLKIRLPHLVFLDSEVDKVVAEAQNGSFCLLPRHVDFTAALVPGILAYTVGGQEVFLAVDEGILVKCGTEVLVSVRSAARGPDLASLERRIREQYEVLDERERKSRSALAGLEAAFIRHYLEQRGAQP